MLLKKDHTSLISSGKLPNLNSIEFKISHRMDQNLPILSTVLKDFLNRYKRKMNNKL